MTAVDAQTGTIRQRLERPFSEVKKGFTYFEDGDVIFAKITPCMQNGKHAICTHLLNGFGFGSTEFHVLRPSPKLRAEWLHYFLRQPQLLRDAEDHFTGAVGQQRVPENYVADLEIPLPLVAEQEQVAEHLTRALAAVDAARRAAEDRVAAAESLPAAYLRDVFDRAEAGEWPRLAIGTLGDQSRGDAVQTGPFGAQLPSSEFKTQGVPVLNIGNVKNGALNFKRLDHVTAEKAEDLDRYRLRAGDMLFTRSGSVGRSAVVDARCEGWLMSYHLLRVAFDRQRIEPGFISAAVRGDSAVLSQVRLAAGRGATRDGINAPILSALTVPVPSIDIQRRVLAALSLRLDATESLAARCRQDLAAIEALPAALLRAAFSGEL